MIGSIVIALKILHTGDTKSLTHADSSTNIFSAPSPPAVAASQGAFKQKKKGVGGGGVVVGWTATVGDGFDPLVSPSPLLPWGIPWEGDIYIYIHTQTF